MKKDEVVYILSGGLIRGSDGKWHTIPWNITDKRFGRTADRWRVDAACLWQRNDPDVLLIASGGTGVLEGVLPEGLTPSGVMRQELESCGVPSEKIVEESESDTTEQQLRALIRIIKERSPQKVSVLSNRWHLPRIRALIAHAPSCAPLRGESLELVASEDVLLRYAEEEWQSKIAEVYASKDIIPILESESRGVRAIEAGTYRYR